MYEIVIQSRINSTSVSICAASGANGGGGRCPRNSRKACNVRQPKNPTMRLPMMIRMVTKVWCLDLVILFLPFQFKLTNRNRIAFLHARLTQCCIYAQRFHDLLKTTQRAIMFPIGHLGRTFNGHTSNAPFILPCLRNQKFAWILFRLINWQWQFCVFEYRSICQFLMSLNQKFTRVRTCQRRYSHELDFKLLGLFLDSSKSFLDFRLIYLVERCQLRLFRKIWIKPR